MDMIISSIKSRGGPSEINILGVKSQPGKEQEEQGSQLKLITSSTTTRHELPQNGTEKSLSKIQPTKLGKNHQQHFSGSSVEEAYLALVAEPSYEELEKILDYLTSVAAGSSDLNASSNAAPGMRITNPTVMTARATRALVEHVVPNWWPVLNHDHIACETNKTKILRMKKKQAGKEQHAEDSGNSNHATTTSNNQTGRVVQLLLCSLRTLAGVNALLQEIRTLSRQAAAGARQSEERADVAGRLFCALETLEGVLDGDKGLGLVQLWDDCCASIDHVSQDDQTSRQPPEMQRKTQWNMLLNIVSGDRIVEQCAYGEDLGNLHTPLEEKRRLWIADGRKFTRWKAKNAAAWARRAVSLGQDEDMRAAADLVTKSHRGSYGDTFMLDLITDIVFDFGSIKPFSGLLDRVAAAVQQRLVGVLLSLMMDKGLSKVENTCRESTLISASAGLLKAIIDDHPTLTNYLTAWLVGTAGDVRDRVAVCRAVVAAIAEDRAVVSSALEKLLSKFGETIYVCHTPILQQEAHAQVLLLLAGRLARLCKVQLTQLVRGASFTNLISNRLKAPQPRARYLGMVVGEGLSSLVHTEEQRLEFKMPETRSAEACWYKSLVDVDDKIDDYTHFLEAEQHSCEYTGGQVPIVKRSAEKLVPVAKKRKSQRKHAHEKTPPRLLIQEVGDDNQDSPNLTSIKDYDNLEPYAKPDSDESDSESDPELVRRDKPKAPVYIRDLILYLRSSEDYDKQQLGLRSAKDIIQRKAKFGTEVAEHAEELARLLISIDLDRFRGEDSDEDEDEQDNYTRYENLRCAALEALAVAQPSVMGPWMGRMIWSGDLSIVQRQSMVVALGLAACNLAGCGHDTQITPFASKRLPERLERLFLAEDEREDAKHQRRKLMPLPRSALDNIVQNLSQRFVRPLAIEAASETDSPKALTVQSYKEKQAGEGSLGDVVPVPSTISKANRNAFMGSGTVVWQSSRISATGAGIASSASAKQHINTTALHLSKKPSVNHHSAVIATYLFAPFVSRIIPATTGMRHSAGRFTPLLPLAVRTVAVLLHAAGPSSPVLEQLTSETWDVMLGLRARCAGNVGLTGAVVEALAALLSVHGIGVEAAGPNDVHETQVRRFCGSWGPQIQDTMEWLAEVFQKLYDGVSQVSLGVREEVTPSSSRNIIGGKNNREEQAGLGERTEEARIRTLAAAVLVRLSDMAEKYRSVLLGLDKR